MTLFSVTMACLLLVPGQSNDGIYRTNKRTLDLPIEIKDAKRAEIRELILWVSTEQGRNYQMAANVPPDRKIFTFHAPSDGEYWFRVAAVNFKNKQEPEEIMNGPPDLKMLIDTVKPQLRITSAQRQGDELVVSWDAHDAHLDATSLKISYKVADALPPTWSPMSVTFTPSGTTRIRLASAGAVSVRAEIRDLAGNASQAQTELPAASGIATANFQNTQTGSTLPPTPTPVTPVPPPIKSTVELGQLSPIGPTPVGPTPVPPITNSLPPAIPPPTVAKSDGQSPAIATNPVVPSAHNRKMPPLQIVNDKEVTVEYKLENVGPLGIGSIVVWLTQDGGITWKPFAEDDKVSSRIEAGTYQRILKFDGEGVFGLCLVVKSKVGLGKPAPRQGDLPEMQVEVDLTRPEAELFKPEPDPLHRDAIVLTWNAKDRNMAPTPITLEWAERDVGPWQQIAANLPNTGKYSWHVPQDVPVQVYLRIRVRDLAGNEGVAITNQKQIVDLSETTGILINVRPAPPR